MPSLLLIWRNKDFFLMRTRRCIRNNQNMGVTNQIFKTRILIQNFIFVHGAQKVFSDHINDLLTYTSILNSIYSVSS